ncbi:MAG TPA: hypothetical protein VM580_26835 [Labilithrix sp.]|nr:hypothetical protein [Labilithrix sp.]
MTRVSVHGIRIDYSTTALPSDPLGQFFEFFPVVSDEAPADLRIELRRAPSALGLDIARGEYVPFFFYGMTQVYRGPSGLVVWNGSSRAEISSNAREIRAEIPVLDNGKFPEFTEGVLHAALLWALRERRVFDLHAAAVMTPDGAPIVIVGDSGAGKTTLMLALVEAGFGYLGDDRVLLRRDRDGGAPNVYSYPRAFHVGGETLRAFPKLEEFAGPLSGIGDKLVVEPARAYPAEHRLGGTSPSLLLFPRVGRVEKTVARELSQADAFGSVLDASAILAVEGMSFRDDQMACLRDLVSSTPCYEVVSGYDLLADPVAVVTELEPLRNLRGETSC